MMGCPPVPIYCWKCGSELEPQFSVTFDVCTGERKSTPLPYLECPTPACKSKSECGYPDHAFQCICGITSLPSFEQYEIYGYRYHTTKKTFFSHEQHVMKCKHCNYTESHVVKGY